MANIPYTQGHGCAPHQRKKLSFLDRYLTLWITSHHVVRIQRYCFKSSG